MDFKDALLIPVRAATAALKIAGRIGVGIAGVVLMSGGLLLIEPFGHTLLGLPLVLLGLLCVVRAVF